jgi:hypothetical protein
VLAQGTPDDVFGNRELLTEANLISAARAYPDALNDSETQLCEWEWFSVSSL